jgi:hypothetical protein
MVHVAGRKHAQAPASTSGTIPWSTYRQQWSLRRHRAATPLQNHLSSGAKDVFGSMKRRDFGRHKLQDASRFSTEVRGQ